MGIIKVFFITLIIIALAVFLLSFNIIFRKNKTFPNGDIGANPQLKKRGIRCATSEEMKLWGHKKGNGHQHQCVGECGEVIENIRREVKEQENNITPKK